MNAISRIISPPRPGDVVQTGLGITAIWIGGYNGINIYRTGPDQYWTPETGFYDTVEEARDSIEKWRAAMEEEYSTEGPPNGY